MQISFKFFSTRSGKSVVLQVQEKKYVFGVFEGFQRYCIEMGFSMAGVDNFFLSAPEDVPGFIGIFLTLSDLKQEPLNVFSAHPIDVQAIYRFTYRRNVNWVTSNNFSDKYISVKFIEIDGKTNFVISFNKIRGTLLPWKIPKEIPKIHYKQLSNGENVIVNGKLFYSCEYSTPPLDIGKFVLVFSQSNFDKLACLFNQTCTFISLNNSFTKYFDKLNLKHPLWHVLDNFIVEYASWFKKQQILHNTDDNYLLPAKFNSNNLELENSNSAKFLRSGCTSLFNKSHGFIISDSEPVLVFPLTSTSNVLANFQLSVTFLGTGCSQPSKYRNVSSILIETQESVLLLDCGEDTISQIHRLYGHLNPLKKLVAIYISHSHSDHHLGTSAVLNNSPDSVTLIGPAACKQFIVDLTSGNNEYLETNSAKSLEKRFNKLNSSLEFDSTQPRSSEDFMNQKPSPYSLVFTVGQFIFTIVGCQHSNDSTSLVLEDRTSGIKIAYSGDSLPSKLFALASRDADLMIHEATFTDDQLEDAFDRKHSTESDAHRIFKLSKAKNLLLTHISNKNMNISGKYPYVDDFFRFVFR